MNENPITITIENYKGETVTFYASQDAVVDIWKVKAVKGSNKGRLIEVSINLMYDKGIVEEDLT